MSSLLAFWVFAKEAWKLLWSNLGTVVSIFCAIGFLTAAMHAMNTKKEYWLLDEKYRKETLEYAEKLAGQKTVISTYKQQEEAFQKAIKLQTEQLEKARSESAQALAEIEELQLRAEQNQKQWQKVYEARPQSCKAALEALDVACPTLKGY